MQTITIFDIDGKRIGNTYPKRAKQLVRNQKAKWMDDERTKISLSAAHEDSDEAFYEHCDQDSITLPTKTDTLYATAIKRIYARKKLILIHFVVYIIGLMMIYYISELSSIQYNQNLNIPLVGLSTIALLAHFVYRKSLHKLIPYLSKEARRFITTSENEEIQKEIVKMESLYTEQSLM